MNRKISENLEIKKFKEEDFRERLKIIQEKENEKITLLKKKLSHHVKVNVYSFSRNNSPRKESPKHSNENNSDSLESIM